jgi:hypothetical protein
MLEKQGVFYTDNAPHTQNHRDDETLAVVEKALADLETEALSPEELNELARTAWFVKWIEKMAALTAEFNAKYPDLVELGSIPLEEWQAHYPTKEAFDALGDRIDAMQSEFKASSRTLVAELPAPFRAQFRAIAKAIAEKNWGAEAVEVLAKEGIF